MFSNLRRKPAPLRLKVLSVVILVSLALSTLPIPFISFISSTEAASPDIVISQVYGGGGNSGATFKNDFIELFNRGTSSVSVTGWSVQYASSTSSSWQVTNLSGTIQPGHYYLVQEAAGTGGSTNLPTPDATGSIQMSATAGKVALVTNQTALTCGATNNCLPNAAIKDFVGFGTGATAFEGSGPTPAPSNTNAIFRGAAGCTDTDNNATDFSAAVPNPRNSTSATHSCTNNPPTITAPVNPITTVNQDAAPFTVNLSGNDDGGVYNWSATPGTGISSVTVSNGQSTANVTYTVTLVSGFTGTATFTASLSDGVNTPATTQAVNIKVNAVVVTNNPPTINAPANPIATVAQDAAPFTVSLTGSDDGGVYNWSATAGTGVSAVSVNDGQGTTNVTYNVTVQSGFSGTATFNASLSDNVNAPVTQVVNISVTPAPANHVVISQVYGGGGNSGAPYTNDYVELYNPTGTTVSVTGWSLQYASASGTSWTNKQPLGGTIGPGEYYLVQLASGTNGQPLSVSPNITGDINMSATTGKIALVSNGDSLSGGCPLGNDPDIIDFVGYGGSATCHEGGGNAPAPSNTTALFRINSGITDTNRNNLDFVTGAPNPRRTAPIVELGPWVASTDPTTNDTVIPHDATITVNFSEPVDVDANWYNINCVSTGLHNNATVAHTADFKTYLITPNVNFNFGEQCTVTILKDAIHDQDTDDSAPNTDTLFADYTWSFTVVGAGDPAPYPPSVHLTMGNPSNAVADAVAQPDNYLMMKPTYALSYNRDKGTPNWVSWHLTNEWYGTLARVDTFRADPAVPPDWYRVEGTDYAFSGFDRGHMTPNADRDNQNRIPINQETYLMSNMVPQAPDNNQGPWANLENYLRTLTGAGSELYIISGPAGVGGTGSNGGVTTTIAGGHVTVPAYTWKVVLVLPKQDGDDVSRVTAATRTIAVIMPNTQGIRTNNSNDWQNYLTTVDAVEQLTGYDFFSNVPAAIQNSIEAGTNGSNPPGTADSGVTTAEDTQATFTLNAVSPNNTPLTTTVVTQPIHGTILCAEINCTYTPGADYNGTDSFTFRVSDGQSNSNTSTVSIRVTEVNDSPVAADDSKSTQEDTPLIFSAGDLTANDSAGPAEESAQTLTVTSVSAGPNTHGTVALDSGMITYTPAPNYNGAASFTYTVCDNGTTSGSLDSKCASAAVNITVAAVNDPPVAHDDSAATDEDSPVNINVLANDTDIEGDALTVTAVTQGAHGSVVNNNGILAYTPATNYNGADSFTYTESDGNGGTASATVNVTINPINDAPSATAQDVSTDEDTPTAITLSGSDVETSAANMSYAVTAGPLHGTLSGTAPNLSYTPAANYNGSDSFKFTVTDTGDGASAALTSSEATVSITVNAVNDTPAANAQAATTDEDTPKAITLTGSDVETPSGSLSFTVTALPAHGTLTGTSPNLTYVPNADYNGTDSFQFTVTDTGDGASHALTSAPATVSITINPVNDAPVLTGVPANKSINEQELYTFTAAATDVDLPAQTLTFSLVGAPIGASIDPLTGQFTWTPTEAQGGTGTAYQFKVRVTDGIAITEAGITINVTEVNQAPTLSPIGNRTVYLGDTLNFTAVGADQDLPAQTLSYNLVGAIPAGASINSGTGKFTWTPAAQQVGAIYTFEVQVTDGSLSAEEQISVGVAYTWSGFLQPVNSDGSSIFKLGRTVPLKFKLTGASAGITSAVARLMIAKISDGVAGTEAAADSTSAATAGNLFRYDAASGQYIFNLSTVGLTQGTYQLRVDMGDGVPRVVNISLVN